MNSGHGEYDTSGSGLMSTPQLPEASPGHFLGVDNCRGEWGCSLTSS